MGKGAKELGLEQLSVHPLTTYINIIYEYYYITSSWALTAVRRSLRSRPQIEGRYTSELC